MLIEKYLLPFLRKNGMQNDLQFLRELYIFTNRPLMSLFQFNIQNLKCIYYHDEVFDVAKKTFTFKKSLVVLHKLLNSEMKEVVVPSPEESEES